MAKMITAPKQLARHINAYGRTFSYKKGTTAFTVKGIISTSVSSGSVYVESIGEVDQSCFDFFYTPDITLQRGGTLTGDEETYVIEQTKRVFLGETCFYGNAVIRLCIKEGAW